jgi:hypothetical protein
LFAERRSGRDARGIMCENMATCGRERAKLENERNRRRKRQKNYSKVARC